MSEVTMLPSEADLGHRVPRDWVLKEMRSLGEVKTGLTYKPEDVSNHGTLVLRSSNIQDERLVFEDNVFVSKKVSDGATVRKGDILICVRNGSRRLIGKSALITAEADGMAFGAFMSAFRSDLSPYLIWVFQSEIVQRQIEENLGATINQITNATLKALKVPVPPPHEQQAIAAALSDADGVVAGLERVIAKKRLIKQGAMQDLLTARRRLPGFSGEWEVKPFAQIARIRNSKVQTLGNPLAQNCIELEQVEHETGRILFWVDATNRATVKYQFEPGDVLFGRLRPYLRKFHRANIQGVCSTEIWPLVTQGVDSGFLYQVVQSDGFIAAACDAYGTHMPRADWGKISTYQIQAPFDPLEQKAIGEVLADMESEILTLESRLAKARAVKEGMMQNLLTGRVRLV